MSTNNLSDSIENARRKAAEAQFSTEESEETLFTIETKSSVWYVDFQRESGLYKVFRDEKFHVSRGTLGEALEYIFNRLPSTELFTKTRSKQ